MMVTHNDLHFTLGADTELEKRLREMCEAELPTDQRARDVLRDCELVMATQSSAKIAVEGFRGRTVYWKCRKCLEHFHTPLGVLKPEHVCSR